MLEVSPDLISPALDRLAQEDRIRPDMIPLNAKPAEKGKAVNESAGAYSSSVIYLTPLYFGEKGVAERLKTLANTFSTAQVMNQTFISDGQLSEEQQQAIQMALSHPVSVLTGDPGTGKTTCLKALITTLETQGMKYALASPFRPITCSRQ